MVARLIVSSKLYLVWLLLIEPLQGEIGILDSKDMDSFGQIFINYQTLGKTKDLTGMWYA
jgi:hypothetical protein